VLYETKREEKRVLRRETNVKLEEGAKLFIDKTWWLCMRILRYTSAFASSTQIYCGIPYKK
jgi:hypothetical protein